MSKHECLEWRTTCGITSPFEADEYNIGYGPGDVEPCIDCDSPVTKACVAVVHVQEPSREELRQKLAALGSQKALLALADVTLAAVVPACACGQFATYETRHRYAARHFECDGCLVRRVQKSHRGWERLPERRQPVSLENLEREEIDTADSCAKLLPSAKAVRAWLAAKSPVPVLGICPNEPCAESGLLVKIVGMLGKAECFRCGTVLKAAVTTEEHHP